MLRTNKEKNSVESLEQSTFSELGFRERGKLREWVCCKPGMFGEDLLIIEKKSSTTSAKPVSGSIFLPWTNKEESNKI